MVAAPGICTYDTTPTVNRIYDIFEARVVAIRCGTIGEDLNAYNAEAPDIRRLRELLRLHGFGCSPADLGTPNKSRDTASVSLIKENIPEQRKTRHGNAHLLKLTQYNNTHARMAVEEKHVVARSRTGNTPLLDL